MSELSSGCVLFCNAESFTLCSSNGLTIVIPFSKDQEDYSQYDNDDGKQQQQTETNNKEALLLLFTYLPNFEPARVYDVACNII